MVTKYMYVVKAFIICSLGASASVFASDTADNFHVSSFGRIVAGTIDTDKANFHGYDDNISLKTNSLLGIQLNAEATDYLSFTAQGVFRTNEDKDSELDWLYATIQPKNNLTLKVGKLRTPFFMHSDVIDVGYAYHWASPPEQMYGAFFLFPTFEGIDATWGYSGENYDSSFEAYVGQHSGEIKRSNRITDYNVDVLSGFITTLRKENFEFRASFHQGDVSLDIPELNLLSGAIQSFGSFPSTVDALAPDSKVNVYQFGVRYDNLDYFAGLEWVTIDPELKTSMPKIDTFYVTGGYIFNPVTIHLTYAESKVKYSDFPSELNQALAGMSPSDPRYTGLLQSTYGLNFISASRNVDSLKSWTLGARWDIRPKLAVKADVTLLDGAENETAMFDSIKDGFNREAMFYQVAVEWVF